MDQAPVVSFIVPTFNYARYLDECLKSIFAQTLTVPFEVLVIDDASTDDTTDVLDCWHDDRLQIVTHSTNMGHALTIREGLESVTGEFVARIDPDDRYRPQFLARTLPVFEAHPQVDLVFGDAAIIDERGTITQPRCDTGNPRRSEVPANMLVELLADNFICAPTTIARRRAWLAVEPVPAWLAFNDWYYTLMMARRGPFAYVDEVIADYRVHGANHHSAIAQAGTEATSARWLLDTVLSTPEADARLQQRKIAAREHILSRHHLDAADKQFWFGNWPGARRNYVSALRFDPRLAWQTPAARRLLATFVSHAVYRTARDRLKSTVRALR